MKTMIFELVNSKFRNLNIALCVNNLLLKITESHLFLEIKKLHAETRKCKENQFTSNPNSAVICWYIKFHLQLNY